MKISKTIKWKCSPKKCGPIYCLKVDADPNAKSKLLKWKRERKKYHNKKIDSTSKFIDSIASKNLRHWSECLCVRPWNAVCWFFFKYNPQMWSISFHINKLHFQRNMMYFLLRCCCAQNENAHADTTFHHVHFATGTSIIYYLGIWLRLHAQKPTDIHLVSTIFYGEKWNKLALRSSKHVLCEGDRGKWLPKNSPSPPTTRNTMTSFVNKNPQSLGPRVVNLPTLSYWLTANNHRRTLNWTCGLITALHTFNMQNRTHGSHSLSVSMRYELKSVKVTLQFYLWKSKFRMQWER